MPQQLGVMQPAACNAWAAGTRARSQAAISNSAKLCSCDTAAASLDREMSEDRSRMEAWNRTEYSELLIITLGTWMGCSAVLLEG